MFAQQNRQKSDAVFVLRPGIYSRSRIVRSLRSVSCLRLLSALSFVSLLRFVSSLSLLSFKETAFEVPCSEWLSNSCRHLTLTAYAVTCAHILNIRRYVYQLHTCTNY